MKKYFTVAAIIVFIAVLFVFSEALYTYNTPPRLSYYFVELAKYHLKSNQKQKAINSLQMATKILAFKNRKSASQLGGSYVVKNIVLPAESAFNQKFTDYLNDLPYERLHPTGKYDLPRIYYELAILAYRSDQKELAHDLLQNTIAMDPTLSYWQVETANYYLFEGDAEKAKTILQTCQVFDSSRQHCKEFLDNVVNANAPEEPGFLINEMEKYYNYPSLLKESESPTQSSQ